VSGERIVLIVEDDEHQARAIARRVPEPLQTVVVHSVEAAKGALSVPMRLAAAVVDIGLPDGNGLDVVRHIRDRGLAIPVLVLTAQLDRELINRAYELDASYLCKPQFGDSLQMFFQRAATGEALPQPVLDAIDELAEDAGLTAREREVVMRATGGVPRSYLAEVMGISENTLKTQISHLLEKTRRSSLSEVVWAVRGEHDAAASRPSRRGR
jgi:two-component system response regulator FixJ